MKDNIETPWWCYGFQQWVPIDSQLAIVLVTHFAPVNLYVIIVALSHKSYEPVVTSGKVLVCTSKVLCEPPAPLFFASLVC